MALGFRKFISEVFVNGNFPKILPSENFPLYGSQFSRHKRNSTILILEIKEHLRT